MPSQQQRSVTFFLSPRIVDLDSYLPVAMEIKAAQPDWTIRFIAFDKAIPEAVSRNPSIRDGIAKCASLLYCGTQGTAQLQRSLQRIKSFLRIALPILFGPKPVLVNSRPYSSFPYDLLAGIAHLRGGKAIILCKNRSPDAVHELMFTFRDIPAQQGGSRLATVLAKFDADALVHYHDAQENLLHEISRFGRISGIPQLAIGMPHRLPAWKKFIEGEAARERAALESEDLLGHGPVYGVFAAKPGSGDNLGLPGAVERSFNALIPVLLEASPDATILIRAHPKAVGADYIENCIRMNPGRVRMTFIHPEVLIALCDRVFANNPTNVLFHGFGGCQVDVSEYPEEHIRKHGAVSLAHGLGPVYADPREQAFKARITDMLENAELFSGQDDAMTSLLERNPPNIGALITLLESPTIRASGRA